jgi:hypothetical protein
MLSLRQFAEQLIPSGETVEVRALAGSLGVPDPISLRYLLEGKLLYELSLESLRCIEKETASGPDHCRLEVFTDGVLEMPLRRDLDEEETWPIQHPYLFEEQIKVKLWDEDWPDPDDLIDTVFIGAHTCQDSTVSMTGDGADYRLAYRVAQRVLPRDFDLALREISLFEASNAPGVWPHIPKSALIEDIKSTVEEPLSVNQNRTPLCGPTAIVYELVARDGGYGLRPQKKRYVQLCRQLWETGRIGARSIDIEPSDDLRKSALCPEDKLSPADWMLIASLRDAENLWEDVEGEVGHFEGYTFPGAMKTWIFEILGFDDADWESCFFSGEIDAIKQAHSVWSKGGVAFLLIHSSLLGGGQQATCPITGSSSAVGFS